jgi:hypothetical protein
VLTLWFQGGEGGGLSSSSSSLDSLELVKFKLAPACVDISDLVVDNEGSAEGLTRMVSGECKRGGGAGQAASSNMSQTPATVGAGRHRINKGM